MSELAPHVKRMHDELAELESKIQLARDFIDTKATDILSALQYDLLNTQISAMQVYANILKMRIQAS